MGAVFLIIVGGGQYTVGRHRDGSLGVATERRRLPWSREGMMVLSWGRAVQAVRSGRSLLSVSKEKPTELQDWVAHPMWP